MSYPKWPFLFLLWARWELPGWGRILSAARIDERDSSVWSGAPTVDMRGKFHGYRMRADLSGHIGRKLYFLGRPHDLPLQLVLFDMLRRGETYIDVGAAGGMMMLPAAHIVGPEGNVFAIEPNPIVLEGMRATVALNEIPQLTLLGHAMGDRAGRMTLRIVGQERGTATLADLGEAESARVSEQHDVEVKRGDDVFRDGLSGNVLIKIDVEGFEVRVIEGFSETIARLRPAIVTECVDGHLERAGTSRGALFDLMESKGYEGFVLDTERHGIKQRSQYLPCREAAEAVFKGHEPNVLWVHPDSPYASRIPRRQVSSARTRLGMLLNPVNWAGVGDFIAT